MKVTIFQLPLSGSPAKAGSASASSTARPFNSLSRDHANNISERRCTGKRLSTPSLGITRRSRATFRFTAPQQTFQLPLSGSPLHRHDQQRAHQPRARFQLPLSGSLSAKSWRWVVARSGTFNSLSRDHNASINFSLDNALVPVFQLPLSGSRKL